MDKMKILIVEDEEIIALELASRVKKLGYYVCDTVTNAANAIDVVNEYSPDIILMDIIIEGDINGIELAHMINQIKKTPIIYCTAFNDKRVIALAKKTLPYGYITKPINGNDLRITLELATHRIKVEQELEQARKELKILDVNYKLLADNSTDLIYVFNLKPEPHYEYISPSCTKLTGYSPEDGYNNPNIHKELLIVDLEGSKKFTDYLLLAPPPVNPIVEQWQRKDGSLIWVEQVITRNYDNDGNIISFQSTVRNITRRVKAIERLRESRERFRSIYYNSTIGLYRTTPGGKILMANPAIVKMLGYQSLSELKEIELAKQGYHEAVKRDVFLRLLEEQNEITGFESEWLNKDGTTLFVKESAKAIKDTNGKIKYIDGTVENITEILSAEKIRRENEEMQNHFFSQAAAGFYFMMLDKPIFWNSNVDKEVVMDYAFEHSRITKVNQAILNQYRVNQQDFIGLTANDLFAHDIAYGRRVFKELFDEGKLHVETKEKRFDGTDIYVLGDYVCLYDKEGRITGHFGVQIDITEQKYALQALSESEKRYKSIIENITDYNYEVKVENGNVIQTIHNETCIAVTGYTKHEFTCDKNLWLKMVFPEDRKTLIENIKRFVESKKVVCIEHRIVRKDGQIRWVTNTLIPKLAPNGDMLSYEGVIKDVTEKTLLQEEMIRIVGEVENRERTRFSQEIHDGLGPLLATIKLYFSWIFETESIDKIKMLAEKGHQNTLKAIQSTKEISRNLSPLFIEKDGLINSLNSFVQDLDAVTETKISFNHKNTVRLSLSLEITIYRIATELINNATKHSNATKIDVIYEVLTDLHLIQLICIDNGIGFDEAKTLAKTTGIGLDSIRTRVTSSKGQMIINSKPEKGTEIIIRLPIFY